MSVYTYPDLKLHSTKRVIIAGSRDYSGGIDGVADAVKCSGFDIEVMISDGEFPAAEEWALQNGIAIEHHYPEKSKFRAAVLECAHKMASVADALICIYDVEQEEMDIIQRMNDKPTLVYWDEKWKGTK